jgi:PAS domain S-box-containing protein
MAKKPAYEELEQRVKELEKGVIERKQAEGSLREEKEFATSIIDNAPIFFVAIDAQGKTMMMNQRMLKMLGYTANEVVGNDYLSNFVPERDRDMLGSVFRKLTAEHEHTFNENYILSKDGKEFLVEWHGTPVFDTSSKLQYFYGLGITV